MDDDDEFGDLYTDVLLPFATDSPPPSHTSPAPPSIDLNQIPRAASHSINDAPDQLDPPDHRLTAPTQDEPEPEPEPPLKKEEESADGVRVLLEPPDMSSMDSKPASADVIADVIVEGNNNNNPMDQNQDDEVKFDIEDEDGGGSEPVIPGLSGGEGLEEGGGYDGGGGNEDWDSDSDDDLQIVLNDDNHMAMENVGVMEGDGEDEDGGLVIVAGETNQGLEEQEWGENANVPTDGERKDVAEPGKVVPGPGGVPVVPKIGYGSQPHGYHPFHSQFKYIRPGATTVPGVTGAAQGGGPPGQIRPLANMIGRGRGDWRPPGIKGTIGMQKGFHAGPGLPSWGNNVAGRGFGGGLEFTLPSHKTIFDVDIESFEEKPWKYPNVDVSDFFNFGLNDETWKDYCKQLEQLRLESTMQSKIRVYESGRTEHDYDPDLPPELAAATGLHDGSVENANSLKSDVGQSDGMKGSGRMRLPMPTGRAIQVEGGYGERLPSIDTRPPRMRDSDAIIEIILQGTEDDESSVGIDVQDQSEDGEPQRESFREDHVDGNEIPSLDPEYSDGIAQDYNRQKKELAGRTMPFVNSVSSNVPNEDEDLFVSQDKPIEYSGSRGQNPRSYGGNFSSHEERKTQKRVRSQSPISHSRKLDTDNNKKEDSVESMEDKDSTLLPSPVIEDVKESSLEIKDTELEDIGTADGSPRLGKEETDLSTEDKVDVPKDGIEKKHNLTTQVKQPLPDESDDWEDLKAARSSDNSKARSASSRDNQKRREGLEEEVVQDPRSTHLANIRQHTDDNEQSFYRKEYDGKHDPERNRMVLRGKEGSYPHKDRHRNSAHQMHTNTDGFDRQKDRDSSDMDWARRDDDVYSRKVRTNEPRKRDRAKVRENERSDKEDSFYSKKQFDNGSYRIPYEKDVGSRESRHKERDEGMRVRYEAAEDYHIKRRKDEEYLRREHIDREEIPHGYRENASRRRRERDEVLDQRKRDDLQRTRDYPDDQYITRQKDDAWLLRERGDRQRDREEWHRLKQSHDGPLLKREREEGRSSGRSVRGAEEKAWVGHVSAKDEHQSREAVRHSDQLKRRDRIQEESSHLKGRDDTYSRVNQFTADERRSRQERSSSRSDRVTNNSDSQRLHERKHKEGSRKSKERDISDLNNLGLSKKSLENPNGPSNEKGSKEFGDQERAGHDIQGHRLSRKHQDGISSDDEQQDSYRGRSKLERWTSHKERDFSINKSSTSLKFKDIDKDNNGGSSEVGKPMDESAKTVDGDNQQLLMAEARDSVDMESRDGDSKESGDRNLDTVERLKKRSERFKLPMPSEKEAQVIKKLESEPLPSTKTENPVESEVKQERPARKRRWISN
ncbi:FIP1[V]-like protein isoform X1 [Vicia villosa]|uniref:FIP1[V]-like protein isoform X1 n=1 Tax=Vicia villosa TaxID=3911 RepID=UPI00273AE364|nr:FIP1[V]-like protein isoform X1 [Vicia villosa]